MAQVIIALDVPTLDDALGLVDSLGEGADFYKVGLELFTGEGPSVVQALTDRDKRVFLDLKLHDIPHTVARAVGRARHLDVELLTVHATGGRPMMEAAAEAAGDDLTLLGVTVLTSMTASDVENSWGRDVDSLEKEVVRLARLAQESGLGGGRGVRAGGGPDQGGRRIRSGRGHAGNPLCRGRCPRPGPCLYAGRSGGCRGRLPGDRAIRNEGARPGGGAPAGLRSGGGPECRRNVMRVGEATRMRL